MREITLTLDLRPDRIKAVAERFIGSSMGVIEELERTYLWLPGKAREKILGSCRDLIELRCPDTTKLLSVQDKMGPSRAAGNGIDLLPAAIEKCVSDRSDRTASLEKTLKRTLSDKSLRERPYLALFYASLLWRLGEFELATTVLENWITERNGDEKDPIIRWYIIRVRTTLTVIFEEWIRSSDNPPTLLLVHHLGNSKKVMDRLEPTVKDAWKTFTESGFDAEERDFGEPIWGATCHLDAAQQRLVITYLKQNMVYAYRATQHPEYFDRYALDVLARRDRIKKLDLSCLSTSAAARALLYAEIIQIYGEVEMANGVRIAKMPDLEAARTRFKQALKAAKLGIYLVEELADEQRTKAQDTLIGDQKATELKYLLDRLKRRAQEALLH